VAGYNAQAFYTATNGEVRQAFEYDESNYAAIATKVGAMQAFATSLEALHAPLSVITNVKDETTNISSTVTDLIQVNAPKVSVVAFGSGSGTAAALATALGVKYVPAGGTVLGILANASVHENIGHVARFPLADDTEFTSVVLSDGQDVRSIAETTLVALDDRGYIFGVTHNGIAGTYCHDSVTAVAATSDFAYIENNRTIDKAKRQIRSALLPDLNAPLTVNADGTLALDTVRYFETLTERPLTLMQNAGEVSNFSVVIDPEQNVLSTSKLVIQVKIQPRGIARQIEVNIGYAVSL
jgi:hypothetical protein